MSSLFESLTCLGEKLASPKTLVLAGALILFWTWESWLPFFAPDRRRLRHGLRNLTLGFANTVILALAFGLATVTVAAWAENQEIGLFHAVAVPEPLGFILALLMLDAWTYFWHRANHRLPILWRFHRMHHSDTHMDATTAIRFHLGEHLMSAGLRLGLIPLLGFSVWHFLVYDSVLLALTLFHHANISLGRWDRRLRWLLVTPDMHKVHHSRWGVETHSNYASVLSLWDRLGRSFRLRRDPATIEFGLDEFADPYWQTLPGMVATPFVQPEYSSPSPEKSPDQKSPVLSR